MSINDQFDENAADLRNIPAGQSGPQAGNPVASATSSQDRKVSWVEIVLAVGVMIGVVGILYFVLQQQSIRSGQQSSLAPLTPIQSSTKK